MDAEVVVVGAGIGGLTVAALLAARGVNVCVLERTSNVGGCAANFDKFEYSFEGGNGLYTSWEPNGIHHRVFSELPVDPPEVDLLEPGYVVRLPGAQVSLTADTGTFEQNLRETFPECAVKATDVYRELDRTGAALRRLMQRVPDFFTASRARQGVELLREGRAGAEILNRRQQTMAEHLDGTSPRFRSFIDAQLRAFAQIGADQGSYLYAALALTAPRGAMFAIHGGGSALANKLADSIARSGGKIRLDTPVLRLAYNSTGEAAGVDLLSGETVTASKAIISNLTIWDTYGKLIGLNRTSAEVRKQLKSLRSWGAYLLYLGLDDDTARSLNSERFLLVSDWEDVGASASEDRQLLFAATPAHDRRAPQDKRAVTVHACTEVDEWFSFHQDETEAEEKDQAMLERCWERLHAASPELGNSIEVIDTATPRTFYESTRRTLGMVGGLPVTPTTFWQTQPSYLTSVPNLFIASDTVAPGGVSGVTQAAWTLANRLTK
ncbi:MAG: FAD-dependent oxidoreductase [Acidobacteriota bacterium]|nr:FAD-dependent oxidoreductase [Acidobacteriota bacterium]